MFSFLKYLFISEQSIQQKVASIVMNWMLCDKLADNLLEIFIPEYDNTNIDKYIKYIKDISYEYYSQYKLNHHITIYDNVNKQYIYI